VTGLAAGSLALVSDADTPSLTPVGAALVAAIGRACAFAGCMHTPAPKVGRLCT
jgi:hypothetical protein